MVLIWLNKAVKLLSMLINSLWTHRCSAFTKDLPVIKIRIGACPKPVPGFPTLDVLVFIVVSDFEVRGDCLFCWYWWNCWPSWHAPSFHSNISHRIIEYKEDYWLNLFMSCKLQHGKLEGIQYLQSSNAWQVVECANLDWCNLVRIQITTKYKIRTK